jgi:hypothetical protein
VKAFSKLFCLLLVLSSTQPVGAQQRKDMDRENLKKTVIITIGKGVLISPENTQVVSAIWDQMKESHSFSEDGEIVAGLAGAPLTSDPEILSAFYRYVAANQVSKLLVVSERCPACRGSGVIYVYPDDLAMRISPRKTDCANCEGGGRVPAEVIYKLICPPDKLPPKSKSPRQRKQDQLEALAKSGNIVARLQLASQFKSGSPLVERDVERAADIYMTLACEGVLEGLEGYLEIVRSQEMKDPPKDFLVVLEAAVVKLKKKTQVALGSVSSESSYLEQVQVRLLADKLSALFSAKKLQKTHLSYRGLVGLLDADVRGPAEMAIIECMKREPSARFDMELLAKLTKAAQKNDPVAFATLAAVSEQGLHDLPNPQAAHIFFSIARIISRDPALDAHIKRVVINADPKLSQEILAEFSRISTVEGCPATLIASILKIKNGK